MTLKLIIFDVDGTLAETYTLSLLPGVKDFFTLSTSPDCGRPLRLAIATNQGGVSMRYWMERQGFGRPETYPTQEDVESRLRELLKALNAGEETAVYVAYGYQNRKGQWAPVPAEFRDVPTYSQSWRKPNPGMLLQAMQDAGARPDETVYIGDRPEDQAAALAAGIRFEWAEDFFNRPWEDCQSLQELIKQHR